MNIYERAELEAENDGYTNEYQRALAASRSRANGARTNGRAAALDMVNAGLFVGVEFSPEYCRTTDALMGEVCTLVAHGLTREEVAARLELLQDGLSDSRFEIWPHHPAPAAPYVPQDDNEVPF